MALFTYVTISKYFCKFFYPNYLYFVIFYCLQAIYTQFPIPKDFAGGTSLSFPNILKLRFVEKDVFRYICVFCAFFLLTYEFFVVTIMQCSLYTCIVLNQFCNKLFLQFPFCVLVIIYIVTGSPLERGIALHFQLASYKAKSFTSLVTHGAGAYLRFL